MELVRAALVRYPYILIEIALVALTILVALAAPKLSGHAGRLLGRYELPLRRIAQRRTLAIGFVFACALAARIIVLPWLPVPTPYISDEFSHLLVADTLASGRLSTTPHPYWKHFESFSILQQPRYASIYAPGPGAMMAIGMVLFGHPFWGVLLSQALMAAAICWMLQAMVKPYYAMLGGLLPVLRFGFFGYWVDSYYGNAIAAAGGALFLGSAVRLIQKPKAWTMITMAAGAGILGFSRPAEGLSFAVLVSAGTLWAWWRRYGLHGTLAHLPKLAVPMAGGLAAVVFALGYYDWRITGNPTMLPYAEYQHQYLDVRHYVFQPERDHPPVRHVAMQEFFDDNRQLYRTLQSPSKLAYANVSRTKDMWIYYVGPALSLGFVGLFWRWRERQVWSLVLLIALFASSMFFGLWILPHYAAPATGVMYALVVMGLAGLRTWKWHGQATGLFLARMVPVMLCTMTLVRGAGPIIGIDQPFWPPQWCGARGVWNRDQVVEFLNSQPGQNLVLVRYLPHRDMHREWVYNTANIDRQKNVWAREMDDQSNRALLNYFGGRKAWLLEVGNDPHMPVPYGSVHLTKSNSQLESRGQ